MFFCQDIYIVRWKTALQKIPGHFPLAPRLTRLVSGGTAVTVAKPELARRQLRGSRHGSLWVLRSVDWAVMSLSPPRVVTPPQVPSAHPTRQPPSFYRLSLAFSGAS